MPAKLVVLSDVEVEPGSPFELREDKQIVVGRGNTADFVLLDREISREHFHIRHDGHGFVLEDLGSVNGTLVNGERVVHVTPLDDGDSIVVGSIQLRFAAGEPEPQAAPEGAVPVAVAAPAAGRALEVHVELDPVEGDRKAHPDHTVRRFLEKHPHDTANKVFRWYQKLWYAAVAAALVVVFLWHPVHFLHVFHAFCTFYLVVILYKLIAVMLSVIKRGEFVVTPHEIAALSDDELPIYTILVPLYKETEVARKVTRYIARLDYPQDKLDVKLLLEADDEGTIEVCRRAGLPANYELIICPDSKPKTKPKACNHGLERARGEFLVIYDAEDRPEPDQLKKAIVAFRKLDRPRRGLWRLFRRPETVCLQAKLNYYNPNQNLLTKWFTIEYSTWFDLFLPGLHRLGSPIPLGGTSNHFKTSVLQHIGGWDPFNVTEDCDLGIRLHKMGYKTRILDSTTWEEANSQLWNWVRQRSRWVKGYIQTHLVHMRNPAATFWRLGPLGILGFLVSVGGLSLMLLLNPIFWAILLFYGVCWAHDLGITGWSWTAARVLQAKPYLPDSYPYDFPWDRWLTWDGPWVWRMVFTKAGPDTFWDIWSQVFFAVTVVLFLANFFFVFMHIWACVRRRLYGLIPYAIFSPLYWVLISLAAWKGFLQLFFDPFKWEKTHHGLDAVRAIPLAEPPPQATPT